MNATGCWRGGGIERFYGDQNRNRRHPDYVGSLTSCFGLALPPCALINAFYDQWTRRAASAQRIADSLRFYYASEAGKVSTEAGLELGLPEVKPHDIFRSATAKSKLGGAGPNAEAQRANARSTETGEGGAGGLATGLRQPADLFGGLERTPAG